MRPTRRPVRKKPARKAEKPKVAGLELLKCPKCGGAAFMRPCQCFMKRQGWEACARCLSAGCGHVFGVKKRRGAKRGKGKFKAPGSDLGPFDSM